MHGEKYVSFIAKLDVTAWVSHTGLISILSLYFQTLPLAALWVGYSQCFHLVGVFEMNSGNM
jgi:hypothetical protein